LKYQGHCDYLAQAVKHQATPLCRYIF